LGREPNDGVREIATMLRSEIHPSGHFRFVNFGHPRPLIFCSKSQKFRPIDKDCMAQFPPLGLEIPRIILTGTNAPSFLFNDLAFLCLPRKSLKFLILLFSPARMELDGQFECFRPGIVFLRKVLDEVVVGSALLIAARCA